MIYTHNKLTSCALACLTLLAPITSMAELEPRDLDNNPATIDAYYDTELDVTWLANANIALDESFGIAAAANSICGESDCTFSRPGIDDSGLMEWPTAFRYIDAMNASGYLGQNNWRLPTAIWNARAFPAYSFYSDDELPNIQGSAYRLQLPNYDRAVRYITSSIGENGGRIYMSWGSASSIESFSIYGNLLRFGVWPLLDGDNGTSTTLVDTTCVDDDGDGWGWNGTSSCTPTATISANSTPPWLARLQPRDLDQNADTIEAYYDQAQDVTWLANSRLAQSEDFGLTALIDSACVSGFACRSHIEANGTMRAATAEAWIDEMNSAGYLGFNQWRLPGFQHVYIGRHELFEQHELRNILDMIRNDDRGEVRSLAPDAIYLSNSIYGSRAYTEFTSRTYTYNGNTNTYRNSSTDSTAQYSSTFVAWPVHDGDIGIAVLTCTDTDGDGWGWNGEASCRVESKTPLVSSCVDTDGDGWGWDGEASCSP